MKWIQSYWVSVIGVSVSLLSPCDLYGWGTKGGWETHKRITADVLLREVRNSEYPDLKRFGVLLEAGSNTESHLMPGEGNTQWWGCGIGPKEETWFTTTEMKPNEQAGALYYYKVENFIEVYKHIGYELHMLQDATVPAHKAFCYHGAAFLSLGYKVDDMEYWAHFHHEYKVDRTAASTYLFSHSNGTANFRYYLSDSEDDDDRDEEADSGDESDSQGLIEDGPLDYGVPSSSWGTYGQPKTSNLIFWHQLLEMLPGRNEGLDCYGDMNSGNNTWAWMYECLDESYQNTLKKLMERSRELPPILSANSQYGKPSVSAAIFGPESETVLSFTVLENRTRGICLNISANGIPVRDASGKLWKEQNIALSDNPDEVSLPFIGRMNYTWKGGLESSTISSGSYSLLLKVRDEDGKEAEAQVLVKYDDVKPTGAISVVTLP